MIEHLRERDDRDFEELLRLDAGRRFITRVLHVCGVDRPVYIAGDGEGTLYREGMRNVGLWLKGLVAESVEPEAARIALMRSQAERAELYDREEDH